MEQELDEMLDHAFAELALARAARANGDMAEAARCVGAAIDYMQAAGSLLIELTGGSEEATA